MMVVTMAAMVMMVVMMTMVTTTALRTMVATQTQFLNPNPTTIPNNGNTIIYEAY